MAEISSYLNVYRGRCGNVVKSRQHEYKLQIKCDFKAKIRKSEKKFIGTKI